MAKTDMTKKLEEAIYLATRKTSVYGCYEVTIGIGGSERVDYMTLDSTGVFRCYEIKVSVADFRSKAKKSFCGHFNYYVLTDELYEKVAHEIPAEIGVYVGSRLMKKAKRQLPTVPVDDLQMSLIRSLARDAGKLYKSGMSTASDRLQRELAQTKRDRDAYRRELLDTQDLARKLYGRKWYEAKEPV